MLLVILACNPPWFSIRLSTIHEVARSTGYKYNVATSGCPKNHTFVTPLQRYSKIFAPPICEKLLLYLYIYINIKSILGGGIGRFFTVTL